MPATITPLRAAAVAFGAGHAVMSLELTAVRIMAPHFGDSAFVWTNVIGVLLVALALGAWIGGRVAERAAAPRLLGAWLVLAAAWTAVVPLLAPSFGGWLLPQELPLDAAMPALVRGSLVAAAVLFAPPVVLAGCMTPVLVAALARAHAVGRASGLVAAASTVGSLVGTFATTHLLVPELGSRATLWCAGGVLLACAVALFGARGRMAAIAAVLGVAVAPAVLSAWDFGPLRSVGGDAELLAEVESRYQYLQVIRSPGTAGAAARRELKINEGLDSFHSLAVEGSPYTGGAYYDYHAVAPFLAGDGARPQPLRVLSLGAAAGTFGRVFAAAHPGCEVDAVELDPAVVALGEQWFGGRGAPGQVFAGLDARVYAERGPAAHYDVVLVDAYEHQIYVPAHVASRQFFAAVARLLRPGGVVSVNSGGRSLDDPVVQALARTMAAEFVAAHAFRVPRARNFVLLARKQASLDPEVLVPELAGDDPVLRSVLEAAARPAAWRRFGRGEPVLDDDRPFLDVLQERALAQPSRTADLLTMAGAEAPAEVERAAQELRMGYDYAGARAQLQHAREPTARLRLLAGDVRWLERDLYGARLEYVAAGELDDGGLSAFLGDRVAGLDQEIRALDRASDVARRNGWLALLACGGLFAFAALLGRL